MAQFHIAEADKDPVCHGAAPYLRIQQRPKADLIQIGLQIQKQTAAGYKIDLQDVFVQWLYR